MAQLYSKRFIALQGLNGTSSTVVVPAGRVYIVKQLTMYGSPLLGTMGVFFHDAGSGAALFATRYTISQGGWVGLYGALVFEAGDSFNFFVDNSFGEGADVFASGYDLSSP